MGGLRFKGLQRKRTKTTTMDIASVAILAQLKAKRKDLRWRPENEYRLRNGLAWAFNLFGIFGGCLFLSLIYAGSMGNRQFTACAIGWMTSYGLTFAIVEPFQVLVLAGAPWLFNEETRCGRCMIRCRFVYNELCAP